ncbi:winged helix-turn-helix domain-containing protein [Natrarchaeobius oligotrophus]|uniref:ArsR family transcriptional regulator n=1 Tax=Natrarchaeobius chitinivorans TaxID=1679083 RepID=A0A3N6MG56_NATCH|nr:winged helix-turn-helix domain-containing protein [Natrarchaeobius chitinivorans]RQG95760.1 ArsR family transcriptional regulator [Natrarchaeobius chitinivorans]
MPIDIETFDGSSESELEGETNAERIITFLARNDDKAFTPSEIAEGSGVTKGSVSTVLSRLEDENLVRHKGKYWAIGDMDRVRDAYDLHRTVQRLNKQYGEEDLEEWKEHAVEEK